MAFSRSRLLANLALQSGKLPVVIETQTAANSASLDFVTGFDDSEFLFYEFVGEGLNHAGPGNPNFAQRVTDDGGSTWKSGASDYRYTRIWIDSSLGSNAEVSSSRMVFGTGHQLNAPSAFHFTARLFDMHEASRHTVVEYQSHNLNGSGYLTTVVGNNAHHVAQAVNGMQFYFEGVNIAEGNITLLGYPR